MSKYERKEVWKEVLKQQNKLRNPYELLNCIKKFLYPNFKPIPLTNWNSLTSQ